MGTGHAKRINQIEKILFVCDYLSILPVINGIILTKKYLLAKLINETSTPPY